MAKVLSSISGNLISAASAGYAPTNSADVSAIASAYQVVSATGTQLYAGTAHVTSINSAPLSASRAGNAANASMATSAYYDGTGRLISSLPDSATVSSIASSYADDKLDKTAEVVTATAGDGTYVTSINGMEISGQGGGGAQVVTATGSASATAFTGGFIIKTSYLVSSINGSAILPYGYDILSSNTATWTSTTDTLSSNSAKWTSTNSAVSANSARWTSTNNTVSGNSAKWASTNITVSWNSATWTSVYNTVGSNSASWGAGATLPITGSTGDDSASYGGGSLEFTRYDTAGEPDIRTATLSPDSLWLNYTLDGNDYSMSLTEGMLNFTDSDGDHIVDVFSIDTWNIAVDTVANNSANWNSAYSLISGVTALMDSI